MRGEKVSSGLTLPYAKFRACLHPSQRDEARQEKQRHEHAHPPPPLPHIQFNDIIDFIGPHLPFQGTAISVALPQAMIKYLRAVSGADRYRRAVLQE